VLGNQKDLVTKIPVEVEDNWSDQSDTPIRPVDIEGGQDRSDQSDTQVKPVRVGSTQIEAQTLASPHDCSEVPATQNDDEEMVDYEPSPT
jgi:hypothetical protein